MFIVKFHGVIKLNQFAKVSCYIVSKIYYFLYEWVRSHHSSSSSIVLRYIIGSSTSFFVSIFQNFIRHLFNRFFFQCEYKFLNNWALVFAAIERLETFCTSVCVNAAGQNFYAFFLDRLKRSKWLFDFFKRIYRRPEFRY